MWRTIVVAGTAWSMLAPKAAAQENPNVGRRLSLVVGPLFVSQRDEKASPVRYDGAVPFLEVGYTTRTTRRILDLRMGGAFGILRSTLTQRNDVPHQKTMRGWITLEYSRALRAPCCRTRWLVGGRVSANATVIAHVYDASTGNEQGYGFFSTTLGPVLAVQRASGERATLSATLGVPLLALIGRPYSVFAPFYNDPRPNGIGFWPRLATVGEFQAADFTAAYTAHRSGADLVLGYHLVVERYRDVEPFGFAAQGVSLTLAVRMGGGP
jgi:hypothetical protein